MKMVPGTRALKAFASLHQYNVERPQKKWLEALTSTVVDNFRLKELTSQRNRISSIRPEIPEGQLTLLEGLMLEISELVVTIHHQRLDLFRQSHTLGKNDILNVWKSLDVLSSSNHTQVKQTIQIYCPYKQKIVVCVSAALDVLDCFERYVSRKQVIV